MHSPEAAEERKHVTSGDGTGGEPASRRREVVERHPGVLVFRCEVCERDIHDLRGVFLVHRAEGWRIECSRHGEAECELDGGLLFGSGLYSLEALADLARARWFEPGDLFKTFLRLRAQMSGLYFKPASGATG